LGRLLGSDSLRNHSIDLGGGSQLESLRLGRSREGSHLCSLLMGRCWEGVALVFFNVGSMLGGWSHWEPLLFGSLLGSDSLKNNQPMMSMLGGGAQLESLLLGRHWERSHWCSLLMGRYWDWVALVLFALYYWVDVGRMVTLGIFTIWVAIGK